MELIERAYDGLFTGAVLLLAVLVIFSIIRSVLGPRTADRIIAVNMAGTMVISIIAILSLYLDENYLVDVCLIYAMISFLGVVVLSKVYTGVYMQKKDMKANMDAIEDNISKQAEAKQPETEDKKMIWQWCIFAMAAVCFGIGIFFMILAVFGVNRFHKALNRMHLAAMGDTLGILFLFLGMILIRGFSMDSLKLLFVILFFWMASPVSGHMISRLEAMTDEHLGEIQVIHNEEKKGGGSQ